MRPGLLHRLHALEGSPGIELGNGVFDRLGVNLGKVIKVKNFFSSVH